MLDLQKLWGREPNYPSMLAGTSDGGLLVYDSSGPFPLVQMSAAGEVVREIDPRPAEGRESLFVGNDLQVAQDGSIWLSDGPEIVRLGASGLVDKRVGVSLDPQTLGKISSLVVDRSGSIYAQSLRSGAVHRFSVDGQLERVYHDDRLLDQVFSANPVDLNHPNQTIISNGTIEGETMLFFNSEGSFQSEFTPPASPAYYQPGQSRFLCIDMTQLLVVSRSGQVLERIRRHANQSWLEQIQDVAVAADGSFAILTAANGQMQATIYNADYTPRCTTQIAVIAASLNYDGEFLVIDSADGALFLDSNGRQLGLFPPEETLVGSTLRTFLVSARDEIIRVEQSDNPTFRRYSMDSLKKQFERQE